MVVASGITANLLYDQKKKVRKQKAFIAESISLRQLRTSTGVTQTQLAASVAMKQGNVAKAEAHEDMLVSTLRKLVEGMGGNLLLVAQMPNGETHTLSLEKDSQRPSPKTTPS